MMKSFRHYFERVRTQQRPLTFLMSRLLWRSQLCRFLTIDRRLYTIRFYPTALSVEYWMNANERKGDEEFMTSYLRRGDVVVDVGANIGALVLTAAAIVGQTGLVYGIEAHPRIFGYLKKNVELNRRNNVRLLNFAAGQSRGAVHFSDENDDDINCVTDDSGLTVQMETLDQLVTTEARRIALLKIDVEGYEKFVIEGAAEVLARTDCIYFEAWEQHFVRNGYDTAAVLKILKGHGFTVHKKLGDADLLEVPVNYVAERCENLVAIRDVARYSRRMKSRASAVS